MVIMGCISLRLFFFLFIGLIGSGQALPNEQNEQNELDDLKDIQASFQAEINAFNAHDQNAFITSAHDDVVLFGTLSPDVIRGKKAFQQLIRDYFSTHANAYFAPVFADFRVTGSTALAWGHYTLSDISLGDVAKGGPHNISHGRYTFTYSKIGQAWQLVALYFSPLQIFSPTDSEQE